MQNQDWKITFADEVAHITQLATGIVRTVSRASLPSERSLAQISSQHFSIQMRGAFEKEV